MGWHPNFTAWLFIDGVQNTGINVFRWMTGNDGWKNSYCILADQQLTNPWTNPQSFVPVVGNAQTDAGHLPRPAVGPTAWQMNDCESNKIQKLTAIDDSSMAAQTQLSDKCVPYSVDDEWHCRKHRECSGDPICVFQWKTFKMDKPNRLLPAQRQCWYRRGYSGIVSRCTISVIIYLKLAGFNV